MSGSAERPSSRAALALVLAAVLVGGGTTVAPAGAAPAPAPNTSAQPRVDQIVRYLQDAQNDDGGWGGKVGGSSDPLFTAWVAMALAAGGVNPQDQAKPGGADAYAFLTAHAHKLSATTDYERVMLSAVAAGAPVRDFGGVDLVEAITSRQLPDGSFPQSASGGTGWINATAFAILPLSALGDPALDGVIARAADWLATVQDPSGGWGYAPERGVDSDMTASVIEALRAAGRRDTPAERAGWAYLRRAHWAKDGGFLTAPGSDVESNTGSTAWTVQGMWAAGIEPATWSPSPPSPLDFLTSMMDPATGEIRWKGATNLNPVWMTAYAAPAFAGYPLPIPTVPRAEKATRPTPSPAPGAMPTPPADAGVTAGGGGEGAPVFSKPEPGSKGNTAGGIRRVDPSDEEKRAQPSTKKRRAGQDEMERPTAASNGSDVDGVTRDVSDVTDQRTAGGRGRAPEGNGSGDGGSQPGDVGGQVIAAPRSGIDGTGQVAAAAPGLRSADVRRSGALAAGLAILLLVAVATGMNLERHRVAKAS